jgi:uncharacterized protein YbaA (DUF1428 family)
MNPADRHGLTSWIVFESREERDRVNAAVTEDSRFKELTEREMPFDGKRNDLRRLPVAVDV